MKSLYEEILEQKEKFEADELRKEQQKRRNLEIRKEQQKRAIIKAALILGGLAIILFIYFQNKKSGSEPYDPYPTMQELQYGSVYLQQGVWYKYYPHKTDGTEKPFAFLSTNFPDQNNFQFCQLSNGFCGIRIIKSDVVLVKWAVPIFLTEGPNILSAGPIYHIFMRPGRKYLFYCFGDPVKVTLAYNNNQVFWFQGIVNKSGFHLTMDNDKSKRQGDYQFNVDRNCTIIYKIKKM